MKGIPMFSIDYRCIVLILVLLPILGGCASATLETPQAGAASPEAPSMPVSPRDPVLSEDFDPWSDTTSPAEDPHAHHHHGTEQAGSAVDTHSHEGEHHE